MRQNQDWSARLFSIHNQITGGVVVIIIAATLIALVLAFGLHSMLEQARWQARASEAAVRLSRLDQKISHELAAEVRADTSSNGQAYRNQLSVLNSMVDDLTRLDELLNDEEEQLSKLRRLQEVVNYWRGDGKASVRNHVRPGNDEANAMIDQMQAVLADMMRVHARETTDHSKRAEQLNQKTLLQAGIMVLLMTVASLVISRNLVRRMVDPLQQMMLATERLSLGDVAPRVEDTQRNEVGQLARAFNKMAAHISEREAATLARNRELDDLHYFNSMLQTSTSEEEIHRALLQKVRALNISQAVILNRNGDENSLTVVASLHPLSERDLGESHAVSPAMTDDPDLLVSSSTPLCRVVRAGKEVVVSDIQDDLMCTDCRFGQQRGSAFCVPITAGGHTTGALHLSSQQTDYWTGERQRLIKALIDQAAPTINNLRLMEKMRNRALVDEQTQVYNRRFLDGYLRKQIATAHRNSESLSVMMLDIDFFKRFNDQYGHEAGDHVLRQFAKAISGALREGELVARYGGEEFTVVVHGTAREAMTLAERLRRAVSELSFAQFTKNGEDVRITMSIGIAEFPTSGQSPEEVLKAADMALYRAKGAGRDCVKMATRTLLAVRANARR